MGSTFGRAVLDERIAPDDNVDLNADLGEHGLAPKLDDDATHFLNGQGGYTAPPTLSYDWNYWRRVSANSYYTSCIIGALASGGSVVQDIISAGAFFVPKTITLDRIGIYIAAATVGSNVEVGIYNNSAGNYPGSLLLDAGAISTASWGLRTAIINQQLTVGLYWIVNLFSHTWAASALMAQASKSWAALGTDLSGAFPTGQSYGWSIPLAYGALPASCPVGGTMVAANTNMIATFVRLSAG
jgi:hypothetical protein